MAVFDYRAVDRAGKGVRGSLEAESPKAARQRLRSQDLFPLEVKPAGQAKPGRLGPSRGRVPAKELAGAMRQLSVLAGAGLPVVEALSAVVEQSGRSRLGRVLGQVKDEVVGGRSLAEALSLFPGVFSTLTVNMIRSGEAAGALELVLVRLAELLEGRVRLRNRVRAALAYPLFMLLVGGVVLAFLFSYVIPTVTDIFSQTGQMLPLPTRILIAFSQAAASYGWLALPAAALVALVWDRVRRTRPGRRWLDWLKLKLPVLGRLTRRVVLVRFATTMATLLASGVSLVDALHIAAKVVDNALYQDSLEAAAARIQEGAALAAQLRPAWLFPPLVGHLVAAGEQSASLDKIFQRLAEGMEEEVESSLSALLSLMEPALILVLGGVVGFIVVSILLPIFDMTRLVG